MALRAATEEKYAEHVPFHRDLAEIEATFTEAGTSPRDDGTVHLLVRRPAETERESPDVVELTVAEGLVGDSWVRRRSETTPDGSPEPDRQLTIMSSRLLAAVAGGGSRWPLAGDQLIVDLDLSVANLPAGARLRVGSAEVEVTAPPHRGCAKFAGRFGLDALRFVSTREAKRQRLRGLHARVVRPGRVRVGDPIAKA